MNHTMVVYIIFDIVLMAVFLIGAIQFYFLQSLLRSELLHSAKIKPFSYFCKQGFFNIIMQLFVLFYFVSAFVKLKPCAV